MTSKPVKLPLWLETMVRTAVDDKRWPNGKYPEAAYSAVEVVIGKGNFPCDGQIALIQLLVNRIEQSVKESKHLHDLLAIIHRDGGHHTEKVGLEQSVGDAVKVIHELRKTMETADLPKWLETMARKVTCENDWPGGQHPTEAVRAMEIIGQAFDDDGASLIQTLIDEVKRLNAILEPFRDVAKGIPGSWPGNHVSQIRLGWDVFPGLHPTLDQWRATLEADE